MEKLIKEVKEIVLCSILFTLVVGMMFFAVVGLTAWERGFIW